MAGFTSFGGGTYTIPTTSTSTTTSFVGAYHRGYELSLIIEDPLYYTTRNYTARLTSRVSRYSHEVRAIGGFWSANLAISASQKYIENWIAYGLGRHLVVYNPSLVIIWEGFVNKLTATLGPFQYEVGPLLDIGNRVAVTYSQEDTGTGIVGGRTVTAVADNTDSQARYGIIQKTYSHSGATLALAEQIRDAYANDPKYAFPPTSRSSNLSGTAEPSITLDCLGYWHWLKAYYPTDATAGYISATDKIKATLAANPNAMFSADYSMIADNATLVKQAEVGERTAEDILKGVNSLGDSSLNTYNIGFYGGRKLVYQPIPTTIEYQQRITSNRGLVNAVNREVKPWDAMPGKYILFPDFLIGQFPPTTAVTLGSDPRVGFVEVARYTAPWGLNLDGKKMSQLDQRLARKGMGSLG